MNRALAGRLGHPESFVKALACTGAADQVNACKQDPCASGARAERREARRKSAVRRIDEGACRIGQRCDACHDGVVRGVTPSTGSSDNRHVSRRSGRFAVPGHRVEDEGAGESSRLAKLVEFGGQTPGSLWAVSPPAVGAAAVDVGAIDQDDGGLWPGCRGGR